MLFKSELYSIEYDEKSKSLVQTVNEALNQNFKRILDFWEIQKLENYVEIRIFSDLEEWKKFYESFERGPYQDYIIGCADGSKIYVLAYDEYKKTNVHKNDTVEDFQKIIIHEFVHICQNQISTPESTPSFIMGEGLATYLADQPYNHDIKIDYPKEDIFNFEKLFTLTNDLYSFSQKIVRKIAEKVPHEKLIEYALNYTKLYNDWESLGFSE